MKIISLALALVAVSLVSTNSFAPPLPAKNMFGTVAMSKTRVNMFGEGDGEQKKLTRDNEPEDFFATNTDKMTDEEKIPIAIAGMVGISLPFILGMIALYAAK